MSSLCLIIEGVVYVVGIQLVNTRLVSRDVSVCPIVEARCIQWLQRWHANGAVGKIHI
jgi:hypothetical protein